MPNNNSENKASVCAVCITYNHEKFLRKALDGFIAQKTDFPFRVIVHDDASTDSTPEIMREYEKNYPELFTMIYQTENQFSKTRRIYRIYSDIIASLVNEKYVTLCEGDDYWCDPDKIQLQTEYMENNPDCSMCVHDTMYVDIDGNDLMRLNGSNQDQDFSMKEVLLDWGRGFHTTSFFCRSETFFNRPPEFTDMGVTDDWQLSIYAATVGKIHYIGKVMSCFRKGNPKSLTGYKDTRKPHEKKDDFNEVLEMLNAMNKCTDKKYNEFFKKRISSIESLSLLRQHKFFKAILKYPKYSILHLGADVFKKFGLMY